MQHDRNPDFADGLLDAMSYTCVDLLGRIKDVAEEGRHLRHRLTCRGPAERVWLPIGLSATWFAVGEVAQDSLGGPGQLTPSTDRFPDESRQSSEDPHIVIIEREPLPGAEFEYASHALPIWQGQADHRHRPDTPAGVPVDPFVRLAVIAARWRLSVHR